MSRSIDSKFYFDRGLCCCPYFRLLFGVFGVLQEGLNSELILTDRLIRLDTLPVSLRVDSVSYKIDSTLFCFRELITSQLVWLVSCRH